MKFRGGEFSTEIDNQLCIAPIGFLLAGCRRANRGGMADSTFDSQLLHEIQKPMHRSGGFDAYQHWARQLGIKLPHFVAFVPQHQIH